MKSQWVKGLRPGLEVATEFGVFELGLGKTKNGAVFLKLLLGDNTGSVEGRVWDPDMAEGLYRSLAAGDIISVQGVVTEFNGLQINIESCLKADRAAVDLNDFRPVTAKSIPDLVERFVQKLREVTTPHLRRLLDSVFTSGLLAEFSRATAARTIHHAYGGGLLEHTLEVMEYCSKAVELQGECLNPDLLLTGAALHDIGKLWEYDQNGITFQLTEAGQLQGGHVILGHDFVRERIASLSGFPRHLAVHLDHLILSHHGHKEWGAVEEPRTLEAVALHHADLISARLNQVGQLVKAHRGADHWTSYDRHLGRSIYVPGKIR